MKANDIRKTIMFYRNRVIIGRSAYLSIILILLLVAVKPTIAFSRIGVDQDIAYVEIANYKETVEYKVSLPKGTATLVSTHHYTDEKNNRLGMFVESLDAKENALKLEAATIKDVKGRLIKWAKFSPDNRLVLAGFEDPSLSVLTSATVYKMPDFTAIMHIKIKDRIRDLLWTADSRSLIILESTDRMKKSPWGLLLALSGHPIEIHTFNLRLLNLYDSSDVRISIPKDYENPIAELRSLPLSLYK